MAQAAPAQETVRQLQRFLSQQGYDPGPADGVMGPKTRAAISAFEEAAGWSVTGRLTKRLLKRAAITAGDKASGKNDEFLQRVTAAAQPFSLKDIKNPCTMEAEDDNATSLQDLGEMMFAFETRKAEQLPGFYTVKKLCLDNALRRVELFYKDGEVSQEDQAGGDIGELRILLYKSEGPNIDPKIGFDLVVFHEKAGPEKYYFAPGGKWLPYRP